MVPKEVVIPNQASGHSASRLEATIPGIIKRAFVALTPLRASIDSLTAIVEVCERGQGVTDVVITLKADITGLRKDVDQLKSTTFTSVFWMVQIPDYPSTDISPCYVAPPTTTGDEIRADVKSEAETDGEYLGVREEAFYEDLVDLEGTTYRTARQASLRNTSMMSSSGAKDYVIPGTDPQNES
ncbi:hypothetical protein H5410_021520, partial [Solanum commersonii]